MKIFYQVITVVINLIAAMFAISLLPAIPALLSSPIAMLSMFVVVSIILYSWFSYKFNRTVLAKQEPVKKSLKDWIRVNGIVAIVFSIIVVIDVIALIQNPAIYKDALEQLGYKDEIKNLNALFYGMLVYAILLLTHVFLTFSYVKKNKEFFTL